KVRKELTGTSWCTTRGRCASACSGCFSVISECSIPNTNATRLRCGSELLGDLIFVCGDRGIYLGKWKRGWSGYGPRPRGRGIVDQCCLGPGCDLHHLEKYCAKAKDLSTTTTSSSTQRLGVPGSPHRDAYRKSSKPSEHRPLTTPHRRTRMRGSTGYPSADPSSSTNS
uniref:Insulin-like domain-containing protein n=1 Tax=Periophthalmus magnuspinnatus TaxID=409849 RepID=A0A3B3ZJW6_9GOBI